MFDVGIVFFILMAWGLSSSDCTFNCTTTLSETLEVLGYIAGCELVALFFTWALFKIMDSTILRFKAYDAYYDDAIL